VLDCFLATQPEVNNLDDASFGNAEIVLLGGSITVRAGEGGDLRG
jgi:hypothetical protein